MRARTPGPWRFRHGHTTLIEPCEGVTRTAAIAKTNLSHGIGPAGEEDAANAAFIVEACNAYDTLRAENERLRESLSLLTRTAHDTLRHGLTKSQRISLDAAAYSASRALNGGSK